MKKLQAMGADFSTVSGETEVQKSIAAIQTRTAPLRNGASANQTSRGAENRQAQQPADLMSKLTRQPADADGLIQTRAVMTAAGRRYEFPLEKLTVFAFAGRVNILGFFTVDGTASDDAVKELNKTFDAVGTTDAGTQWGINFSFSKVDSGGDIHMNWMSQDQVEAATQEHSASTGDQITPVAVTETYGIPNTRINPLFRSVESIMSGYGVRRAEAQRIFNHTRKTFGHEFSHGAGIRHAQNSTKSLVSYSADRELNSDDFLKWCVIAGGGGACR